MTTIATLLSVCVSPQHRLLEGVDVTAKLRFTVKYGEPARSSLQTPPEVAHDRRLAPSSRPLRLNLFGTGRGWKLRRAKVIQS
ncbi:MAG TPA: hypothetical protein VI036_15960 [Propionibacteriaceae bacterium]